MQFSPLLAFVGITSVLWGVIQANFFSADALTQDNAGEQVAKDETKTGKDMILCEDLKGNMKPFGRER